MGESDIINWIKENSAKGYTSKQLEELLIKQGHDKNKIKELVKSALSPAPKPNKGLPPLPDLNEKPKKKVWVEVIMLILKTLAVFAIIIGLIISYGAISDKVNRSVYFSDFSGEIIKLNPYKNVEIYDAGNYRVDVQSKPIDSDSAQLVFMMDGHDPVFINFDVGESKNIDVGDMDSYSDDDEYDLIVKLESIDDRTTEISIEEFVCNEEDVVCDNEFGECIDGWKIKEECIISTCGPEPKVLEKEEKVECQSFKIIEGSCGEWNKGTSSSDYGVSGTIEKREVWKERECDFIDTYGDKKEIIRVSSFRSAEYEGYTWKYLDEEKSEPEPEPEPTEQAETIDCGVSLFTEETIENYMCFVEASKECEPAKVLHTLPMNIFGLISSTNMELEIRGYENGKCIYYQKTIDQTLAFDEEMNQEMLDSGKTQEEIDAELVIDSSQRDTWGDEKTCKFEQSDLTAMLETSDFSESNFANADCK